MVRRRTWRRSAARTRFGRSITASFAASIAAACRSLPRRIVGAAASFFVCSARESMIEVVRASGSALRQQSAMRIRNGGGADSEQRAAAFGILAPLAVRRRARLAFAVCSTAHVVRFFLASQLPLAHCHVKPPVSRRLNISAAAAAAASAEARQRAALSSAEQRASSAELTAVGSDADALL